MAQSESTIQSTVEIALDNVPEVIATALNSLGYSRININAKYRQATAREDDSEQYGMDRFDFTYFLQITWKQVSTNGVEITLTVREQTYTFQQAACKKRCQLIVQELERNSVCARDTSRESRTTWGSARFGTVQDLYRQGYLDEMTSKRFLIGTCSNKEVSVPEKLTQEHVLICGPTGSGKSSTMFIPNLLTRLQTSALVTEAASGKTPPVLYHKTARHREKAGHIIHYFNPEDRTSTRINPLDAVQSFDDAIDICHLIIRNTQLPWKVSGEQIWEQSETALLNSLILYAVGLRQGPKAVEGDNANLAYIRNMLRAGPDDIGDLISKSRIPLARLEYSSFLKNTSTNFRFGVVSGLLSRLNPWVNKKIAALTQVTDLDAAALKNNLFTFYFVSPTKKPQLRSICALAFNYIFDIAQDREFKYPVTLLLDELANFGYIPELPDKLTHIRNQGIGVVLGIQNPVQLSRVYTDKDATLLLTQPGTRIYFRPRDNDSAQKISRSLGNSTILIRKVLNNGAIHEDERQRPLMDPSEVERLPKSKVIVFTPSTDPLLIDTFLPWQFDHLTSEPPSPRREVVADESLVSMCDEAKQRPDWQTVADQQIKQASREQKSEPGRQAKSSSESKKTAEDKAAKDFAPGQEKENNKHSSPWGDDCESGASGGWTNAESQT